MNEFVVDRKIVEQITLVGPRSESTRVIDELSADGFRVTRSGPYTDKDLYPKLDMTRFLLKAERTLEEGMI